MNRPEHIKQTYRCNIILFLMVLGSILWMESGWILPGTQKVLSGTQWSIFKYFTVDSNILMGLVALYTALWQRKILRGEVSQLPKSIYRLNLAGVTSVLLTFFVTAFFLVPTSKHWITLYMNSNFFLHLVVPLFSAIVFCLWEKTNLLKVKDVIVGLIPLALYAIYYVANCLTHAVGNQIPKKYDWYGFFLMGINSVWIVLPIILVVTGLISLGIRALNRRGI